jgi:hypothetical protein
MKDGKLGGALHSLTLTEVFPGNRDKMLIRLDNPQSFYDVMDGYIAFDHMDDTGSVYNYYNHEKTGRVTLTPNAVIFEPYWY